MVNFFQALEELIAQSGDSASSVLTSLGVPSVSIAISTPSGIISHTIANSYSPVTPSTRYQACSISKPICGLAVLRTLEQGKLSLTDPITKHLSEEYIAAILTPSTRPILDHVIIKHLLSHTAGITVGGFPGYDPDFSVPSIHTVISGGYGSNTQQIRLNRFPGLKWRYSGGGTTILQVMLESIHKKSYPDIVKELVFEPLDMNHSSYNLPKDYAECWVTGVTEARPRRHIQPEFGAAGLWTTPTDLLKALRGIRNAARGSGFLSKEIALMGLTEVEGAKGFTSGGWIRRKGWVGHGGSNNPGYRCELMATWGVEMDEGIAIMTNSAMGTDVCSRLIHAVGYLRRWPGREVVDLIDGDQVAIPFGVEGEVDVKDWSGKWEVEGHVLEIEGMSVKVGKMAAMKLMKAATPSTKYGQKVGVDVVVEGMEMMLAMGYNESGEATLEVWPGFHEEAIKCKRL